MDESGIEGTTIQFDSDLDIDNEDYPFFEIFLDGEKHFLNLSYTNIDYSGSNFISKNIVFNGQTYPVNSPVDSSLEYRMIDLSYGYRALRLENILAGISLAGVIQTKYLDGEVLLETTGILEKEDFAIPLPMVGLNLHLGILKDLLEARVTGTGLTYSGNTIYEFRGDISVTPLPLIAIHGGYRILDLDADEEDIIFNYNMSGPYVMLTVNF